MSLREAVEALRSRADNNTETGFLDPDTTDCILALIPEGWVLVSVESLTEAVERLTTWPGVVRQWPDEGAWPPEHVVAVSRDEVIALVRAALATSPKPPEEA